MGNFISGVLGVVAFVIYLYGVYQAFLVSIILGIVALVLPPLGFINGIVLLLTGINLASMIL